MNRVQRSPKNLVKNITNPGSAAQLRRLDVPRGSVQRRHVAGGELGDDLQQGSVLVHHILAVGVEQRLELGRHDVGSSLQLRETVAYVVHQEAV